MSFEISNRPDHFEHHVIETYGADGRPKRRDLYVPDAHAREEHANALTVFTDPDIFDPVRDGRRLPGNVFVDGSMPGTSIIDGILPHKDNWSFYKLDIKDAFPSVDPDVLLQRLIKKSVDLRKPDAIRWWLNDFMTEFATSRQVSGLPLGAPASPYLFNFYMQETDQEIAEICDRLGLTYTRYLDDITVSSPKLEKTLGEDTRRQIRAAIEATPGMTVNRRKIFRHQRDRLPVIVTGVALHPDGRIQPRPELLQKTWDAFHAIGTKLVDPKAVFSYSDLGLLDGYHGVLVGMTVKPYSDEIKRAIDEYHQLRPSVIAAIEMTEESSIEERVAMRRERLADYVIKKAQKDGMPVEIMGQVTSLRHMFPEWTVDQCILVATLVLPLFEGEEAARAVADMSKIEIF